MGKGRNQFRMAILACGFCLCATGCGFEGPMSVRRIWVDHNTLNTPALYYDKIHHEPMDAPRVRQMRWMYGHSPARTDLQIISDGEMPSEIQVPTPAPKSQPPKIPGPPPANLNGGDQKPSSSAIENNLQPVPEKLTGPTAELPQKTVNRVTTRRDSWRFMTR
jgi:hypothetical protein